MQLFPVPYDTLDDVCARGSTTTERDLTFTRGSLFINGEANQRDIIALHLVGFAGIDAVEDDVSGGDAPYAVYCIAKDGGAAYGGIADGGIGGGYYFKVGLGGEEAGIGTHGKDGSFKIHLENTSIFSILCSDDSRGLELSIEDGNVILNYIGGGSGNRLNLNNGWITNVCQLEVADVTITAGFGIGVQTTTMAAGATSLNVSKNIIILTGDAGGNTLNTLVTGAPAGQEITIIFTDANITVVNDDAHTANQVDLLGGVNLVSADDTVLKLVFNGTSWYEVSRSVN